MNFRGLALHQWKHVKTCSTCETKFVSSRRDAKTCSDKCRKKASRAGQKQAMVDKRKVSVYGAMSWEELTELVHA